MSVFSVPSCTPLVQVSRGLSYGWEVVGTAFPFSFTTLLLLSAIEWKPRLTAFQLFLWFIAAKHWMCVCSCGNTHTGWNTHNKSAAVFWVYFCCGDSLPLCVGRLSMNGMSGKAALCHRKPSDSTMYMAQLSLPGASFELTHMWFVYSYLTAADSNIWLVYLVYHIC